MKFIGNVQPQQQNEEATEFEHAKDLAIVASRVSLGSSNIYETNYSK